MNKILFIAYVILYSVNLVLISEGTIADNKRGQKSYIGLTFKARIFIYTYIHPP